MKLATFAPAYVALYPLLAEVVREHGYALAIHGSVGRDFDLVAVPWTEEAIDTLAIARVLIDSVERAGFDMLAPHGPERKAHGRLAWTIPLGCGAAIDLSVVPWIAPGSGSAPSARGARTPPPVPPAPPIERIPEWRAPPPPPTPPADIEGPQIPFWKFWR